MKLQIFAVLALCLGITVSAVAQQPSGTKGGTTKGSFGAPATTKGGTGGTGSGGTSGSTAPRATGGTGTSGVGGTGTSGAPRQGTLPAPGGAGTSSGTGATTKSGAGTTTKSGGTTGIAAPGNSGPGGTAGAGVPGGLTPPRDLASYAIGLDIASRFESDGTPINIEYLIQGLKDGFNGGKPRYPEAQLRAAAEAFDKEMQARSQERFKALAEKNKKDGAVFLAENKKKKTIKTLTSGLQYEVIKAGAGKTPRTTDTIRAHYHGTLIDGTVFDTTQNDQPVEIEVTSAIAGWTEALQMMKTGDKWRLFVPSELAYGEEGFGPVPPNAVLIFDLELLEIVPTTPAGGTPLGSKPSTTAPSNSKIK